MQALILAAGQGRRLGDRRGRPKCLREVGGRPLVHHTLTALAEAGIDDVMIVVGFGQDQIRDAVGSAVRYVVNDRFAETNSMYSFMLAHDVIDDDVLVINSDVLFHPALVGRLAEVDGDGLLYDSSSGEDAEQMSVQVAHGRLVGMSKAMRRDRVSGENLGMLRLTPGTVDHAAGVARTIAGRGGERLWLAAAINRIAISHAIHCVDVAGWPWVEIDFPEDLARARAEVFPSVVEGVVPDEPELGSVRAVGGVCS